MDFFLWKHLKEHVYAVPPMNTEVLMASLQADVTTVAAMLRRVRENVVWPNDVCLDMDGS
jgi:hypothetical protein